MKICDVVIVLPHINKKGKKIEKSSGMIIQKRYKTSLIQTHKGYIWVENEHLRKKT